MVFLAAGVTLDFYLIAWVILGTAWAAGLAVGLLAVFAALWWVLPRSSVLRRA